ncbi:MAG: bile acid:sodium symporter [Pseudomonadota bacterium]
MAVEKVVEFLRAKWFSIGLLGISVVTLTESGRFLSDLGMWFKAHHGAEAVIVIIFFLSGLIVKTEQIKTGLSDIRGTALALFIIFVIAPLTAWCLGLIPLSPGIRIGLFLVAVMPTTLSSGVVMTGASGGNTAHALLITILANGLAVFTIPISLTLLLKEGGNWTEVSINGPKMMIQIGTLVLVPLFLGLLTRFVKKGKWTMQEKYLPTVNQCMILFIVWIALSEARAVVVGSGGQIFTIIMVVFVFHGILLVAGFATSGLFKMGPGRRESVIFMGGQKTLPLSVLLQVTLFPQYGLALIFCVVHHLVHLIMDGYLVGRLAQSREGRRLEEEARGAESL